MTNEATIWNEYSEGITSSVGSRSLQFYGGIQKKQSHEQEEGIITLPTPTIITEQDRLGTSIGPIYGYARAIVIPVFRQLRTGARITYTEPSPLPSDAWAGENVINANLFGFFEKSTFNIPGGQSDTLLVQQGVIAAGNIESVLGTYINGDAIGLGGIASGTQNAFMNSAHYFNTRNVREATVLGNRYLVADRSLLDVFTGMSAVTGIYYDADIFDNEFPTIEFIIAGNKGKRINSMGMVVDSNNATFGLYSLLIDYISDPDYGMGLSGIFDTNSWTKRTRGGIALTQDMANQQFVSRIRQTAYDADDGTKENYTIHGSPIPALANWPMWGNISTLSSFGENLREITDAAPPLMLWFDLNGKLKADFTLLDGISPQRPTVTITDHDIIGSPNITIPSASASNRSVTVSYNDYENDFAPTTYEAGVAIDTVDYSRHGTYQYIVPNGVTKILVTARGADGGDTGNQFTRFYGGDGGDGYRDGTDGGDARGAGAITGRGGFIRGTTNKYPTGGNEHPLQGDGRVRTAGTFTPISESDSPQEKIDRTGTGGGAGITISNLGTSDGGAGGGGSSAITRSGALILEAYGGRGAGGPRRTIGGSLRIDYRPWSYITCSPEAEQGEMGECVGERGILTSIELNVNPGDIYQIIVGQGGEDSKADPNEPAENRGRDGFVRITTLSGEDTSSTAGRVLVSTGLCGSRRHAGLIANETSIRGQLHRISMRLTKKHLGIEPGDIIGLDSDSANVQQNILVIDRGIQSDLTVNILGVIMLENPVRLRPMMPPDPTDVITLKGDVYFPIPEYGGYPASTVRVEGLPPGLFYVESEKAIVGTIHENFIFQPMANVTITASNSVGSDTWNATFRSVTTDQLLPAEAGTISLDGSVAPLDAGQRRQFAVTPRGGIWDAIDYTWDVSGPGSISDDGLYTSSATDNGMVTVTVTATYRGTGRNAADQTSDTTTASASFLVFSSPLTTRGTLGITGSLSTLSENSTRQFRASVSGGTYDTVDYSWSVSEGNISQNGRYTALDYDDPLPHNITITLTATFRGTGVNSQDGSTDTATAVVSFDVLGETSLPSPSAATLAIGGHTGVMAELEERVITVTPTGGSYDTVDYVWNITGGGTISGSGSSITYRAADYPDNSQYSPVISVTATFRGNGTNAYDGPAASASTSATLTVQGVGPLPTEGGSLSIQGGTSELPEQQTREFTAQSIGGTYDTVEYSWHILSGRGSLDTTTGDSVVYRAADYDDNDAHAIRIRISATYRGTGDIGISGTSDVAISTIDFDVRGFVPPDASGGTLVISGSTNQLAENSTRDFTAAVTGGTYDIVEYSWSETGAGTITGDGDSITYNSANYDDSSTYPITITVTATFRGIGNNARNGTTATRTRTISFNVQGEETIDPGTATRIFGNTFGFNFGNFNHAIEVNGTLYAIDGAGIFATININTWVATLVRNDSNNSYSPFSAYVQPITDGTYIYVYAFGGSTNDIFRITPSDGGYVNLGQLQYNGQSYTGEVFNMWRVGSNYYIDARRNHTDEYMALDLETRTLTLLSTADDVWPDPTYRSNWERTGGPNGFFGINNRLYTEWRFDDLNSQEQSHFIAELSVGSPYTSTPVGDINVTDFGISDANPDMWFVYNNELYFSRNSGPSRGIYRVQL